METQRPTITCARSKRLEHRTFAHEGRAGDECDPAGVGGHRLIEECSEAVELAVAPHTLGWARRSLLNG